MVQVNKNQNTRWLIPTMQKYGKINRYTYLQMLVMKNVTDTSPTGGDQSKKKKGGGDW